jgi:hypothetical protein
LIRFHLGLRPLGRTLLLNGGNPTDEIAALVIGVAVAFVVWLILRNRVPADDDEDDGDDLPAS